LKRREFVTASAVLALLPGHPAQAAPPADASGKPAGKSAATKPSRSAAKKSAKPAKIPPAIRLPDEPPPQWRNYELHTTLTLEKADGGARLWLPLVQYRDTPWERSFGHRWQGNYAAAGIYRDPVADMEVFYADWPEGSDEPKLEIVSAFATQNRQIDIIRRNAVAERTEILRRCLQATRFVPTGGIVRLVAERAVGRIRDPLAQAKALYDWVVENADYDPQAPASGGTSIASLLENGRPAGRSIEISLLFTSLCRAIGIPARPVFGLRMGRSRLFASLGASGELNASQHCRAEFYSPGYGWIPVDPSDVLKVIRNEAPSPSGPRLTALKKLLFGFWEMNWVGFNAAQDVLLQGSNLGVLPFLFKPVVETREGRFDDPASGHFSYSVGATEREG
jgi:transglutaminase-like putative cysteine protease